MTLLKRFFDKIALHFNEDARNGAVGFCRCRQSPEAKASVREGEQVHMALASALCALALAAPSAGAVTHPCEPDESRDDTGYLTLAAWILASSPRMDAIVKQHAIRGSLITGGIRTGEESSKSASSELLASLAKQSPKSNSAPMVEPRIRRQCSEHFAA